MTFHTANALDLVWRLDRDDIFDHVPQNKKQNVATGLFLEKLRAQDFAGALSSRTTRVPGPISRHRVADILRHMKLVSRASRPGLLVGFFRIICNGLCTARKFHTAENDHTCRIGCPDEPDSLTHYNECPRLHNFFLSFWRHATILPRRNHILHDLITRVVLGFLSQAPPWFGTMTPEEILAERVVGVGRIAADFRDAFERTPTSSTRASGVNKFFNSQSPLQRRLSFYNWNPGPRRGTEDAIENKLRENGISSHCKKLLTTSTTLSFMNAVYVTLYSNIDVKSIYLHDTRRILHDRIVEGEHWWVLQGVVSRASWRRVSSGQTAFTVLSLHINNVFAKKRGIAKKIIQAIRALMISKNIDLVARDFNGAAWRCRSRDNFSSSDEAFADCALPTPPGSTLLWDLDPFWTIGRMSGVFWSHLVLRNFGKLANMAPFPFLDKLSVCAPMMKAATMKRGCTCISSIGVTSGTIRLATTGTSASQNVLRILEIVLPNATFAWYWATTRSHHSVRPFVFGFLLLTLNGHSIDEVHVFFITKWLDEHTPHA